ncbi:hypothetical protein OGATHE_002354, partial [Ogataea polymorpha]
NSYPHQTCVPSVTGPMCRYLEDLELVSKVIIDAEPWLVDAKVPPIPWKESVELDTVNVGIMVWDKQIKPHPPILRALKETETNLKKAGIDTLEVEPPVSHLEIC